MGMILFITKVISRYVLSNIRTKRWRVFIHDDQKTCSSFEHVRIWNVNDMFTHRKLVKSIHLLLTYLDSVYKTFHPIYYYVTFQLISFCVLLLYFSWMNISFSWLCYLGFALHMLLQVCRWSWYILLYYRCKCSLFLSYLSYFLSEVYRLIL